MCGIIAVVRRPSSRLVPQPASLASELGQIARELSNYVLSINPVLSTEFVTTLQTVATRLQTVDQALRGSAGLQCILLDQDSDIERAAIEIEDLLNKLDVLLDSADDYLDIESFNTVLVKIRDSAWAIRHDRLRHAANVQTFSNQITRPSTVDAYASIDIALTALDRLEVRGRDSAGIQVTVSGHALNFSDSEIKDVVNARSGDLLYRSGSIRVVGELITFVYKAAAEIGELGDNTAKIRSEIQADELLRLAVQGEHAQVSVLGHTRWASVGIISEANAHPLNQESADGTGTPFTTASLNGDIDNYGELAAAYSLEIAPEITTDAKVIPMLFAKRLALTPGTTRAFAEAVCQFEGSVAIGAQTAVDPHALMFSLRGSGQGVFVGLAEDTYIVASEPYGLVEHADTYLRLDGEVTTKAGVGGQVLRLDPSKAGSADGVERVAFDGSALPIGKEEWRHAEVTTRDIDRGDFPHYLLKEITEAPKSFRKTLRGKLLQRDGKWVAEVGEETIPAELVKDLRGGHIRHIVVIGQGTAAIAGQAVAVFLTEALYQASVLITVNALPATELSGSGMNISLVDTLVIAITQSGTTTDTNRTIDVARTRGAKTIAIVNRRNSDIVSKVDGVLYTSDGRDIEMSVASTKAFYAQIAAGALLSNAIAKLVDHEMGDSSMLEALRQIPAAMNEVLATRENIGGIARRHAPSRRAWAIVGNGKNRIAAEEIRIKLSELCYKAIASDFTEDKKHIDLSSEPLIFVCAAGLTGSNADDVAKELQIYKAHKATPIIVATRGDTRYEAAADVIEVPTVHPGLDFVLAAMAGHLFGYEAALAIDALARPFREARAGIETTVSRATTDNELLQFLESEITVPAQKFFDDLRAGQYDGTLDASLSVRLASLLYYAIGVTPLELYEVEFGKVGTPSVLVDDLTAALTQGIDALTRPVDAIKHQAKTVTVGISRSDESLLRAPLVQKLLELGVERDRLSYRVLRTLADLDPAIENVLGYTRYRVEGDPDTETATVDVIDRGGVATGLKSRTETDPRLRGTKHRAAYEREVTVAVGRNDGRTVIIVPEVKGAQTTGLTLLHVDLHAALSPELTRRVLQGYRNRYGALKDAVTEIESHFDDAKLAQFTLTELFTEPVNVLADRWSDD